MKIKTILAAFVLILPLMPNSAVALSEESWICLQNTSALRKLILVKDIKNDHWDGVSRPDHNWNGTYVEANQTRCERAEMNRYASAEFSFIINGRTSQQKIQMSFEKGNANSEDPTYGWAVYVGRNPSSVILRGSQKYRTDLEIGGSCSAGGNCNLFTIQDVP